MAFRDWEEIAALPLPIRGKTYHVKPMTAAAMARVLEAREATKQHLAALADAAERDVEPPPPSGALMGDGEFHRLALGDAYHEMVTDLGAKDPAIVRAAMVALADAEHGRQIAERLWEEGPSPEALAAEITAAIQTMQTNQAMTTSTRSRRTASGNGTRSRASTSATKASRSTSSKATRAKAARSSGRTSSPPPS
jgi:hypothetical protein